MGWGGVGWGLTCIRGTILHGGRAHVFVSCAQHSSYAMRIQYHYNDSQIHPHQKQNTETRTRQNRQGISTGQITYFSLTILAKGFRAAGPAAGIKNG